MKSHTLSILLMLFALLMAALLAACADATAQPGQPEPTRAPTQADSPAVAASATPQPTTVPEPTLKPTAESATPIAVPTLAINVTQGDGLEREPVFTIPNNGRYSGEAGQAGWLGWGADSLAVAPDGSFWIADTPADPDRLLHYSYQGVLLHSVPLRFGDRTYWGRDLAAGASGLWVLDYLSQPGVVLHLSLDGSLLASYEIPGPFATHMQEENALPGLWHIAFVEDSRAWLDGPVGIVELSVTDGSPSFTQVTGYTLGGRTYTDVQDGLMVDDLRVGMKFLQPDHFLNRFGLLGAAWDGSFYVRVDEGNNDQAKREPGDSFVRRYSATGELLGIALLPLQALDQAGDVALGPDGNVFVMVSTDDHAVNVSKLKFSPGPAPLLATYTDLPEAVFSALLPSGDPPATDLDAAREAMLAFFAALAERRYTEAAPLFGGSYDEYSAQDSAIRADQPAMAWELICMIEFCLPVSDILDSRLAAPDTYEFLVGFAGQNGGRYDYGICCGYFGPTPVSSFFVYSVKVKQVGGQWQVMGGPAPLP